MQYLARWSLIAAVWWVGCAPAGADESMFSPNPEAPAAAGSSGSGGGHAPGGAPSVANGGQAAGAAGSSMSSAGAGGAAVSAGGAGPGGVENAGGNGGGAGASGDACAGRLFCDDFEEGTVGAGPLAPWKARVNGGQAKYDDSKAVSGKRSMKLSQSAGSNGRAMLALEGAPAFPLKKNVLFGRFMFFTDKPPTPGIHSTFLWAEGKYMGADTKYTYAFHDKLLAVYFRSTKPSTECWQHKLGSELPTGKWQCMAYELNGETNEMRFALGPQDIPELHVVGSTRTTADCVDKNVDPVWHAPSPFTAVVLGWENFGQDVARDTWIDDVVVDDEPVACPP